MSHFVVDNNKIIPWFELVESFNIKPVEYGTDEKNGKILTYQGHSITLFSANGNHYEVVIGPDGLFGFGALDKDEEFVEISHQNVLFVHSKYSDNANKISTGSALSVFNNVFYVLIEIVKKSRLHLHLKCGIG